MNNNFASTVYGTIFIFTLALSTIAMADTADTSSKPPPTCNIDVNTDSGNGGMQAKICNDGTASIGVGGPIKDVDVAHPVGKGDAFLPKAGRDAQRVVQDVGHGAEHATHEVGKAAAKIFGW